MKKRKENENFSNPFGLFGIISPFPQDVKAFGFFSVRAFLAIFKIQSDCFFVTCTVPLKYIEQFYDNLLSLPASIHSTMNSW